MLVSLTTFFHLQQNSNNSIGLGINLGTVIGGPSSGSSGGTGSPLSGITSGETSPPGIPGASKTTTLLDANGGNGSNLLGKTKYPGKTRENEVLPAN